MDLQHVKLYAEYGTAVLYAVGVVGFFIFALTLLKTSFKHFFVTTLLGVFWPLFIIFALIRGDKKNKEVKYIEIRR